MKWPKERLSKLILPVNNWAPQASSTGNFTYIDIGSVDSSQKKIVAPKTIPCRSAPSRARQIVRAGDTLVATVRPNLNCVALVGHELDGSTASTGFCVLRCDESLLDPSYLFHWVQTKVFVSDMVSKAAGASYPAVSDAIIHSSEIPLPPLEEQRRIAAILDKTAEISDANKHRQDLLKAFPLSVYKQMLGDPRQNPFQWPVFSLGEICLNEDARRVPVKSSDRKAMQGRFPYYGASGIIDNVDGYLFDGPRLLVGEDGANLIARSSPIAFVADGKYWVNNHAHVLGENGKAKLRFLEYYFALVDLKPFVTGSAQPKLTRSALDSLPVPLPPLELQEQFESVLSAMNITLAQAKTSNEQALSLSNALRHISFQGEGA